MGSGGWGGKGDEKPMVLRGGDASQENWRCTPVKVAKVTRESYNQSDEL